ncbi:peroxide stress protein YaaA [Dysosmobacter sp.]|uniref:peroxide stress protein YaaA n=1 Tax=Dysosmobacter sp. TaxID=2591382 RepID=UPI002A84FC5F|nr:peroxide stress protein YaaA [Dysosmobacter sp.]MDY3282401.1 peroxide stress protein YaaA [Dysosmobacter sp.]
MRIIISPAKKMNRNVDSFACRALPRFLPRAEQLCRQLQGMTYEELKALWKCNDRIAQQNVERLQSMDLHRGLTPAILAYEGIQYQYMAPGVFTSEELEYVQEHLRILSGFYGILRPFDGVVPYRLEMQAKLPNENGKDLYSYWGKSIADALFSETDCVLNLASREYSQCVSAHLKDGVRFVTCRFCQRTGDSLTEKVTLCKMARGEMVRYLAERQIESVEQVRTFDRLGYHYEEDESDETVCTFVAEG